MAVKEKPLCVIPARGSSKRFPRKNIAKLMGKPLLAYAIEQAKASGVFDCVCVSTEDQEILEVAQEYGADLAYARPSELASDDARIIHVCAHMLEYFSEQGVTYNDFAVLLPTSPLRRAEDIKAAYQKFQEQDANFLMTLVAFSHPPQRAVCIKNDYVESYFGMENMVQTQKLEPLYRHDGSFIFAKSEAFLQTGEFYGSKVLPYIIDESVSVDIDNPLDLKWAEFLLSQQNNS